ncbi:MAG: amidohydrolase family protein [Armatimonadetes bacterium]|nr:amidohydrolase family protein [Armatimonadota bacterium]
MTLRPYGIVIDGRLELGLEVVIDESGTIDELRPHNGAPEPYVLSPAFVNAHSHFEYRGLLGQIDESSYFDWIAALTRLKRGQDLKAVREDCLLAAAENRSTGVGFVCEHSDRPFSGEALASSGPEGIIFQEVITFGDQGDPARKLEAVAENVRKNAVLFKGEIHMSPHAPWSVDPATLQTLAEAGGRISIHVAESVHENDYFRFGRGPIAELCADAGMEHPQGVRVVSLLSDLGFMRPGVQFVHACDVDHDEVALIAESSVTVAHCPRSNEALNCPRAPVRELLDAGVSVGLGLDSAASSGSIDMFAEMRAAVDVAAERGGPLTPEEVWRMATCMGAESVWLEGWDIAVGQAAPLIKILVEDAEHIGDLIAEGAPDRIEWVSTGIRN